MERGKRLTGTESDGDASKIPYVTNGTKGYTTATKLSTNRPIRVLQLYDKNGPQQCLVLRKNVVTKSVQNATGNNRPVGLLLLCDSSDNMGQVKDKANA